MSATVYSAKEGQRFATDTDLTVVSCASCHMTYAIPSSLHRSAVAYPGGRPGGWDLTCPLGHTWHYLGRSVEGKLKDQRDESARLRARLDQARASASAQKGAATRARRERDRIKQRVAGGVCPCCSRTFKKLARHMAGQHPEYVEEEQTS